MRLLDGSSDAHLCSTQQEILVWIATEAGPVVEHRETWHPTFHVSGNRKDLQNLIDWLWQPELRLRYGIESYAFEMKRTELGSFDMQHLLSITLHSCATLRSLAEHIDACGEHVRFTLYSVDVRPEQQFLTSKRLTIGSSVRLHDNQLTSFERTTQRRDWRCCRLDFTSTSAHESFEIRVVPCDTSGNIIGTESVFVLSESEQLSKLEQWFNNFDPHLVLSVWKYGRIPRLLSYLMAKNITLYLGRNKTPLRQVDPLGFSRPMATFCVVTLGFPLEGRIHIDLSSSFMFREGGLDGLYELARISATRIGDAARKISWFRLSAQSNTGWRWKTTYLCLGRKHVRRIQNLPGICCSPIEGGLYLDSVGVYAQRD